MGVLPSVSYSLRCLNRCFGVAHVCRSVIFLYFCNDEHPCTRPRKTYHRLSVGKDPSPRRSKTHGKSTLLRTLAGFLPPISGSVHWLGRELTEIRPRELSRLLSIVLTDRPDTGFLTVREIVETGRMPYTNLTGRLTAEDREVTDRALYLTDTADFARRRLTSLSDGERQRVMIAKALAQQTPVILLDEPTAFLDYPGKIEMLELLTRLAHEEHKTILISTHDLELTFQTADRLWLLGREGIQQGATREMLESGVLEKELKYTPRVVGAASADQ